MLCRGGVTFVDKMGQFILRVQSVDNTPPSGLNSEYSVKRYVQLSPPSSHRPTKRSVYQRICHTKASMWMSRNKRGW